MINWQIVSGFFFWMVSKTAFLITNVWLKTEKKETRCVSWFLVLVKEIRQVAYWKWFQKSFSSGVGWAQFWKQYLNRIQRMVNVLTSFFSFPVCMCLLEWTILDDCFSYASISKSQLIVSAKVNNECKHLSECPVAGWLIVVCIQNDHLHYNF